MNDVKIALPYGGKPLEFRPPLIDIADVLPEQAREKLWTLRRLASDEAAVTQRLSNERFEAIGHKEHHERNLMRMLSADQGSQRKTEDSPRVLEQRHYISHHMAEIERLDAVLNRHTHQASTLVRHIERWLQRQREAGVSFVGIDVTQRGSLKKGETAADAVERIRQRVRHLRADLRAVEATPIPSSLAKEIAREQIETRAKAARPDVLELVETGGSINWPAPANVHMVRLKEDAASVVLPQVDAVGLLAWLHGDAMIAAVEREIDAMADDSNALTPCERKARKAEIAADILALEREEEALIEQAGGAIARRPDADPRAVLAIALVEA